MTEIQFVILGLSIGTAYVLAGQGVVLVYRGSGLLNFGQGATAMLAAEVFYRSNLPRPVGIIVAVGLAACVGLATDLLVLRRLRRASALVRLIATLGLLTLLFGVGTMWWGDYTQPVTNGLLPTTAVRLGGSLTVGADRLILFGVALVMTTVLSFVYQRTRYGIATSAAAEDQQFLAALGWSPSVISAVNWTIGSALAGIAGILLAPISGLSVLALTFIVIPSMAAALIGRFSSFWLTAAGGLALGVAQSLLTLHVSTPGWTESAPFLVIVIVIVVRGRALPLRGEFLERPVRVGTGRIPVGWLVSLVAASAVIIGVLSDDWLLAVTSTMLLGIIALSLVLITGYAGQISLAQLTIAGVGAVVAGNASHRGVPFVMAVLMGALAAMAVGLVFALPALRCRGANLAVVTIGLSLAIEHLVLQSRWASGGPDGLKVNSPSLFGLDVDFLLYPARFALVVLAVLVVCAFAVTNIRRGPTGRRLLALRNNERAAAAAGVNILGAKLYAFAVGAAIAGLGGALATFQFPRVNLSQYTTLGSIMLVVNVVVGGIGYVFGALNGGLSSTGGVVAQALSYLGGERVELITAISGGLVLLILVTDPNGIFYRWANLAARVRLRYRNRRELSPKETATGPSGGGSEHQGRAPESESATELMSAATRGRTLSIRDLKVRFGTVQALSGVSLDIAPGEVVGVIGPNGAGKTTIIDAICGMVRGSGQVRLGDVELNRLSVFRRARAGLGRTFQSVELFEDMTVLDNIRTADESRRSWAYAVDWVRPRAAVLPPVAIAAISDLDLWDDIERRPDELPSGRKRLVGIARALAAEPAALLLDEPAAGLSDEEKADLGRLIRELAERWRLPVLLIEHDVQFVASICDRVIALSLGSLLSQGTPHEVLSDRRVVAAYLGADPAVMTAPARRHEGE